MRDKKADLKLSFLRPAYLPTARFRSKINPSEDRLTAALL